MCCACRNAVKKGETYSLYINEMTRQTDQHMNHALGITTILRAYRCGFGPTISASPRNALPYTATLGIFWHYHWLKSIS